MKCPKDANHWSNIPHTRGGCQSRIRDEIHAVRYCCTRDANHKGTHHNHYKVGLKKVVCAKAWTTEEAIIEAL